MASTSFTAASNGFTWIIEYTETVPANYIETNKTKVNITVKIKNGAVRTNSGGWSYSIYVDGVQKHSASSQTLNTTTASANGGIVTVFSKSDIEVEHTADGSKTITLGAYIRKSSYTSYDPGTLDKKTSISFKLTDIPRASTPTVSTDPTMGSAITITSNRPSGTSFAHKAEIYQNGTLKETIPASGTFGDTQSWTPSASNYSLGTGPNITVQLKLTTYVSSSDLTSLGEKTIDVTLRIPTAPTISAHTIAEGNSNVPSGWGFTSGSTKYFIKNISRIVSAITASDSSGATITEYKHTIEGKDYFGASITSDILTNTSVTSRSVQVTSSRNNSTQASDSYTLLEYAGPVIEKAEVRRCTTAGTYDDDGTNLKYTFKASIPELKKTSNDSAHNAKSYNLKYRQKGTSNWTTVALSSLTSYSVNVSDVQLSNVTFDNTKEYEIMFEAIDTFQTKQSTIKTLGVGADFISFGANGKSLALGKTSSVTDPIALDKKFEVALESYFENDIYFKNRSNNNMLSLITWDNSAAKILKDLVISGSSTSLDGLLSKATTNESNISGLDSRVSTLEGFVSSGSNSNGGWLRVGDYQVCWKTISTTKKGNSSTWGNSWWGGANWTYPQAFISEPVVSATAIDNQSGLYGAAVENSPANTNVNIESYSSANFSTCYVCCVAFGKWR